MRYRWPIVALGASAAILVFAAPQIGSDELQAHTVPYVPPPEIVLRAQTDLVEVPVVVRDRQNKAVAGLTANDFTILDNGKKQEITAFSVESFASPESAAKSPAAPRFIALCLDDLNSDREYLMSAKKAARQFVQTSLAPGDRVAIATIATPHVTEFTADVPTMLALIDQVVATPRTSDNVAMDCPPLKAYEAYVIANQLDESVRQAKLDEYRSCARLPSGQTVQMDLLLSMAWKVWDRALLSNKDSLHALEGLVDHLAKAPGRRMILLASSGFYSGELDTAIDGLIGHAIHANVVIDTLDTKGVYTVIPVGDGAESRSVIRRSRVNPATTVTNDRTQSQSATAKDDVLAVVASGTGGMFFHDNNDLVNGFRQLGMLPEVIYLLGFSPTGMAADGRFHTLKVQLRAAVKGSVQARKGYSAPGKPAATAPSSPQSRLDSEMKGSDTLSELPAHITWQADQQKRGVTYTALIDLKNLTFLPHENRRAQKLTLVTALRDQAGNFVAGKRSDVDLYLTNETFDKLVAAGGLRIALTVEAPPGIYTARGLVQDGLQGKIATSSWQLQLQ